MFSFKNNLLCGIIILMFFFIMVFIEEGDKKYQARSSIEVIFRYYFIICMKHFLFKHKNRKGEEKGNRKIA